MMLHYSQHTFRQLKRYLCFLINSFDILEQFCIVYFKCQEAYIYFLTSQIDWLMLRRLSRNMRSLEEKGQ